jgi:hypothetical protein
MMNYFSHCIKKREMYTLCSEVKVASRLLLIKSYVITGNKCYHSLSLRPRGELFVHVELFGPILLLLSLTLFVLEQIKCSTSFFTLRFLNHFVTPKIINESQGFYERIELMLV